MPGAGLLEESLGDTAVETAEEQRAVDRWAAAYGAAEYGAGPVRADPAGPQTAVAPRAAGVPDAEEGEQATA